MKYWYLEKYLSNLNINKLKEEIEEYIYIPKIKIIDNINTETLKEEELLFILNKSIEQEDKNLILDILKKLLLIPNNNLPKSDYTTKEILEEISNLKNNIPEYKKLSNNNIAACYTCQNIFYIDKIKKKTSKDLCLCPYCNKTTLYFDNDFIPMNKTFILLAKIYNSKNKLGSNFNNLINLAKKIIEVKDNKLDNYDFIIGKNNNEEEYIYNLNKEIEDLYMKKEYYISLFLDDDSTLDLLIVLLNYIGKNPYIKKINIYTKDIYLNQLKEDYNTLYNYRRKK
ncbi:MAG: hypothetical protein PHQ64_02310 [Bacilli bacterium]|nr:hypothetical protein [Bacilli bacterium]